MEMKSLGGIRRGGVRVKSRSRTSVHLALILVLSLATTMISAPAAQSGSKKTKKYPVILVPGLSGGLAEIAPIQQRLQQEGFTVLYFNEFDFIQSNELTSNLLSQKVKEVAESTKKVNLACFSAGVSSCRYSMKYGDIEKLVQQVVLYAGGNGSFPMCILPDVLGGDNCVLDQFAIKLELGDDTPGKANYFLITSFPPIFTPVPDGGLCYHYIPFEGNFRHPFEPFELVYQDAVAAAMQDVCTGEFVDLPITNSSLFS